MLTIALLTLVVAGQVNAQDFITRGTNTGPAHTPTHMQTHIHTHHIKYKHINMQLHIRIHIHIASTKYTDPAWARIINAAQHVTAAETEYWAALSVVNGFPVTVNLGNVCVVCVVVCVVYYVHEPPEHPPSFFSHTHTHLSFHNTGKSTSYCNGSVSP